MTGHLPLQILIYPPRRDEGRPRLRDLGTTMTGLARERRVYLGRVRDGRTIDRSYQPRRKPLVKLLSSSLPLESRLLPLPCSRSTMTCPSSVTTGQRGPGQLRLLFPQSARYLPKFPGYPARWKRMTPLTPSRTHRLRHLPRPRLNSRHKFSQTRSQPRRSELTLTVMAGPRRQRLP